jgi:hypothetical protein
MTTATTNVPAKLPARETTNTALTGATYDIDGGRQLVPRGV